MTHVRVRSRNPGHQPVNPCARLWDAASPWKEGHGMTEARLPGLGLILSLITVVIGTKVWNRKFESDRRPGRAARFVGPQSTHTGPARSATQSVRLVGAGRWPLQVLLASERTFRSAGSNNHSLTEWTFQKRTFNAKASCLDAWERRPRVSRLDFGGLTPPPPWIPICPKSGIFPGGSPPHVNPNEAR